MIETKALAAASRTCDSLDFVIHCSNPDKSCADPASARIAAT